MRQYVRGVCPNQQMNKLGKYRRNLITFKENSRYLMTWSLFSLTLFLFTIFIVNTSVLSPSVIFWLYNIVYFTFYDIFHGLVIPWKKGWQNYFKTFQVPLSDR